DRTTGSRQVTRTLRDTSDVERAVDVLLSSGPEERSTSFFSGPESSVGKDWSGSRSFLQPFIEEVHRLLDRLEQFVAFPAVPLAFHFDQRRRDAETLQFFAQQLGLRQWHQFIFRAVDKQKRRVILGGVGNRGSLFVGVGLLGACTSQE